MAGLVLPRKEREELRREQAIERNAAYQEQISTARGIRDYMQEPHRSLGTKQMKKLEAKLKKLER
tara:strand:- start:11239 stop:11433 length:195 start_codon:yes stop_codon:yes gene_type:complete